MQPLAASIWRSVGFVRAVHAGKMAEDDEKAVSQRESRNPVCPATTRRLCGKR